MQLQQSTAATFFTAIAAINAATNGNAAACDLRRFHRQNHQRCQT